MTGSWPRGVAAAVLTIAVLSSGAGSGLASPQLGDAKSRAQALRQSVDSLTAQAEAATESYDAAGAKLAAAVTARLSAQRRWEDTAAGSQAGGTAANRRIRSLYESGGRLALYASVLDGHDLHDVLSRYRTVRSIVDADHLAVVQAGAAVQESAQVARQLRDGAAAQTRLEQEVGATAGRVQALLGQQRDLLARADAEVVRIADADRRAAVAAAAEAFRRQLAAAQAAQAAQAQALALAQAQAVGLTLAQALAQAQARGQGPALATTDHVPPSAAGALALAAARSQLGKPYLWGATGPDAFDCSGLTGWAYAAAGIRLPRVAADQWNAGPHVALADLAPGDLLFWAADPADPTTIHHVGIYAGAGVMVDAPHAGAAVQAQPVYLDGYVGATRPTSATPGG